VAELALKAAIGDYRQKTQGDSALLDTVNRRMRDPREWTGGSVVDDLSHSQPL
jgi:hypothetical protein